MNIDEYIYDWAKKVETNTNLITESKTPHDTNSLLGSFSHDVSQEKMVPTVEFLQRAYEIINKKLLKDKLPYEGRLFFRVESKPRMSFIGYASYLANNRNGVVTPTGITLNSARTLTLHEWLEVVLHEMVHVCDYRENPRNFLRYNRRHYDPHGYWFLNFGKQFEKDGFNVQKYCTADIGVNTDDKRVKSLMDRSIFILLEGYKTINGNKAIVRISKNEVQKYQDYFAGKVSRGYADGLKTLVFLKTDNPNIIKLKALRIRDMYSNFRFYYFSENFQKEYGPFTEVGSVDILHTDYSLREDKDEVDFDDMNHIDDEQARKIYDNIDSVVGVKKVSQDEYEVAIA